MMSHEPLILEWEETVRDSWREYCRQRVRRLAFWGEKLVALIATVYVVAPALLHGSWWLGGFMLLCVLHLWLRPYTILLLLWMSSEVRHEWDQPYTTRVTIDDAGVRTESPGKKWAPQRLHWRRFRGFEHGDDGYMLKFDYRPLELPARAIPTDEVEQQLCNILTQHLPATGDPVAAGR
jgi:hypothetical protein